MGRLEKAIKSGRFAWEKYINSKTWNGITLRTQPLFCSYGQIGYQVFVYDSGRHSLTLTHDWEMNTTSYEYAA